jgi:hypothetical protein
VSVSLTSNESFSSTWYGISLSFSQRHHSLYSSLSTSCRLYKFAVDKRRRTIFAHSLSRYCLLDTVKKRNTKGKWGEHGDKERNILFIISPRGTFPFSSYSSFLKVNLYTATSLSATQEHCLNAPGSSRMLLRAARWTRLYHWLLQSINLILIFAQMKFSVTAQVCIVRQSFVLFFNISFSFVIYNCFVFSILFSTCINDEISTILINSRLGRIPCAV